MTTQRGWGASTLLMALAMACAPGSGAPTPSGDAALRRMASCDEVKTRMTEALIEQTVDGYYGGVRGGLAVDDAAEDSAGAPNDGGGDAPTDFTTTNVQEAGVDELDIVKMNEDGTVMYVAQDRALHIVDTWPIDEAKKLGSLELDGWVQGLFVHGDTALVVHNVYGSWGREGDVVDEKGDDTEWFDGTRLSVVDVSDPSDPTRVRTIDVEGYLADARMVDGDAYLVLNQYLQMPDTFWQTIYTDDIYDLMPQIQDWSNEAEIEAAKAQWRSIVAPRIQAAMATIDVADVLPQWREDDAALASMYDCTDLYAPGQVTPLAMLSVMSVDLDDGDVGTTGLMSQGWTIYASMANLYVAQTSRWWWGWDDRPVSHIHKFALKADAEPTYVASGEVDGWMYDQFAMSEYDGYLRAVTTDFGVWWFDSEEEPEAPANNVFVLEDDGEGSLLPVGHVGGIAPNEQVQAVRMMGEKGYVVTFERTDPLFTIDLSDPTDPKVVGELHMPGFSAYLHPVGDGYLLGVGMQGLETGELTGLKVNIFDVRDMSDPKIAAEHDLSPNWGDETGWSWSWSEALWDHHAFTYHRDTLTIPAMMEHYDSQAQTWEGFSGTLSFLATPEDGISELGRVDHESLVEESVCLYDRWYDWSDACSWDYGYWYARVRRSVYIEDNLFTISDYGVKINDLEDPSVQHASIPFYPVR